MGGNQAKIEAEKAKQKQAQAEAEYQRRLKAEEERIKAEEERKREEEKRRIMQLEKEKQELEYRKELERQRIENEKRKREKAEREERIRRERIERERREREEKLNAINKFKQNQNIADFLSLISKFNDESQYLVKTLEALNEDKVIKNYKDFKNASDGKIEIIREAINEENLFSSNCLRKLVIILLCNEKNNGTCDKIFEELVNKNDNFKKLLFNILIDYSDIFGPDISFKLKDGEIYRQFVKHSLGVTEYQKSLNYRNNDLIQLKLLNENIDQIINLKESKLKFNILNDYDGAYQEIQYLIKYEKEKNKKIVYFPKTFWENYYNYYIKTEKELITKINKLVNLYKLLLSYIDLGKDDSDYKEILAEKIHNLIEDKLKEINEPKEQLELLFTKDPYYEYDCEKRDPNIFEKINLLDLKEEGDIKYFQEKKIETIYKNEFNKFLGVIIKKINKIEYFNSTIKIIKLEEQNNRHEFINLLKIRLENFFNDKLQIELLEESFIILFCKTLQYYPEIKLEILDKFLKLFGQNNNIYLKVFENINNGKTKEEEKEAQEIKKKIIKLSTDNLELPALIDLIKKLNEKQRIDYFNNIDKSAIVIENDFFDNKKTTLNLELLMKLVEKKLIPQSMYLDKTVDNLNDIYNILSNYDEVLPKFEKSILNDDEEIQNKYSERFKLFKLIKGDEFDSDTEFTKIKDRLKEAIQNIEKAHEISGQLSHYYKRTDSYMVEIDKINNIYNDYSIHENKVNIWINKEDEIIYFIRNYEEKANLIKEIREIKLFDTIYKDICEEDESVKFDKAIETLNGCKVIFEDIQKGDPELLDKWRATFKKELGIEKELTNLKNYYKLTDTKDLKNIAKNITIFTRKNAYESDIRDILYFFKIFDVEKTELSNFLSQFLDEKTLKFKEEMPINFETLVKINNLLEDKKIYIDNGKGGIEDSSTIKLIKLFYPHEDKINFVKTKGIDNAQALLYKLNPTTDSLKFNDIIEYQSCISFVHVIMEKRTDVKLLEDLGKKIEKDDINKIISTFRNYFINYGSIKSLDTNFDSSNDIYENIKDILNNSEFKIEFFKMEFKVYDKNNREKDIMAKDLDGLIQIKDNINLNFELPGNESISKDSEIKIKEKKKRIEIFVRYVERLQNIIRYFKKLENRGCPFIVDIRVIASKDIITYKLVDESWNYDKLIFTLKEFCKTIMEYQLEFYKTNEYFRLVYDRQLYRLFKRTTTDDEDISSYIRFFTNGDSTNDEVILFDSPFSDPSLAYKLYKDAIKFNFQLISDYIKFIFKNNKTSLKNLYKDIQVKDNLKGLYRCNVKKYNMDLFIIKIFLQLTDNFPIAQNILLTNNETTTGEIYSFMYRAMKCNFNTLFIISISDDFSKSNLNQMTSLKDKIIREMIAENIIKDVQDIKPCIIFITQNPERMNDFSDAQDLQPKYKGDENKLEYILGNEDSIDNKHSSKNAIYDAVRVYTSDCAGLGKSYLIKKEIIERGDDYIYFGIGDDITKDDLYIKLEFLIKHEIKLKAHPAIHLDLFYTKNIPLMKYFLFAVLITKLYQTNDNILYIPKNINIYVEIPNGPQHFLDDYPILTIFQTFNISLESKDKDNIMTCIEKKSYLKIINYLSSDINEEEKSKYNEKIEKSAKSSTKCVYSNKLRNKDVSHKNKEEKQRKDEFYDFYNYDETYALEIQYNAPLIFKNKDKYIEINISDDEVKDKDLKYFLSNLKQVMSLEESEEEIEKMLGKYKITEDNYKKMILILFRIFANIPVILMGETGCGKTELIKQLMKMLNKDKDNQSNNFITKNMHSGVKESEIIEVIEQAEKNLKESKNNIICIFFDEINTTSLLSKMKEIFVNHSLNGKEIDERIRFIGACNPFRRNKNNEGDEGLKLDNSNNEEDEMTYMVNPLPNSLLNYIFYFKSLENRDVEKYIESIIGEEFPKGEDENSDNSFLREKAIEAIYFSHNFVREQNGISSVSLRDLQRFKRAYKFFNDYYDYKKIFLESEGKNLPDKISKIQSFVLSLFITYYIKIFKSGKDNIYLQKINKIIKQIINKFNIKEESWKAVKESHIFKQIVKEEEEFLLNEMDIKNKEKGIGLNTSLKENIFLMFFAIYAQIPLIVVGKPGCSKSLSIQLIIRYMIGELSDSNFLKDFPTINSTGFQGSETNTPESIEKIFEIAENKVDTRPLEIKKIFKITEERVLKNLNNNENKDKLKEIFNEERNDLLKQKNVADDIKELFNIIEDEIINRAITKESIINIFKDSNKKISKILKKNYISLLVFDELGLSERSPTNCLKVLHSKLEMSLDSEDKKQISFIGISNWRLDAAKMNRTIFLAIPEAKRDDILLTIEAIAKSYSESLYNKYDKQYKNLGDIYYDYKKSLAREFGDDQDINNDSDEKKVSEEEKSNNDKENIIKKRDEFIVNYHGGRDLYNIVKIFSAKMLKVDEPNNKTKIDVNLEFNKSIARNLNGLEINGESSLKKYIKNINFDNIKTMDLIKDNIASKDTRFLLLATEKSMFGFLIDIIKKEIENHVTYIGSPFKGDRMNASYQAKMISSIENSVKEGKVIILSDLEQIYSTFYDLFNQNYISKDGKKYCRISHGANIQKLAPVNENTKFIVLVDKKDLRKQKLPFLSRFEKHIITFDTLLDDSDKDVSKTINNILNKLVTVEKINYKLDNLLVNTNEDIINGYVYLYKDKEKKTYKDIIREKVIPILSQDIIFTMPLSALKDESKELNSLKIDIKNSNCKYNSLKDYLQSDKRGNEDILIVYTFSNTGEAINLHDIKINNNENNNISSEKENINSEDENKMSKEENYMERITSEINTVYKFNQILKEFHENKNCETLILKFESENAQYINYFISEIRNFKENEKEYEKEGEIKAKKYIFTINIKRELNLKNKSKKVTTVLITDDKIKQLFIDNINGTNYSIEDIENIDIKTFINLEENKKIISEELINFFRENKRELGKYKNIDSNNFISEFEKFTKSENELAIEMVGGVKKIILNQVGNNERIISTIIEKNYINQNTTDFITAVISYIKNILNENIKELLKKIENNNFFTTLFMLNVKDNEQEKNDSITSNSELNDYINHISDIDILKNEIIIKIKKEFLKLFREGEYKMTDDQSINIKINYKIPGFYRIYKELNQFIEKEKISFTYMHNETELRKSQFESRSFLMTKLKNDKKNFNEKLYIELTSKQLMNKIMNYENTNKHYIEFVDLFLIDYITFYLEKNYNNNQINNFIINDIPHRIILLLLDLKFKELKDGELKNFEEETLKVPLRIAISKILWLEANSKYIKYILDLYYMISNNIIIEENSKDILFNQILDYNTKSEIIYSPKEPQLTLLNTPFYKIIVLLFKCIMNEDSFTKYISKNKNDNYYYYFKKLDICLKEMQKIDKVLKLDVIELSILTEFITIFNVFYTAGKVDKLDINLLISNLIKSLVIIKKNDDNKIMSLEENLKNLIQNIRKAFYDTSKENEIKGDTIYYELISNILLSELKRENDLNYQIYILNEFLLTDTKFFIQSNQLLKIILENFVSSDVKKFTRSFDNLSKQELKLLEEKTITKDNTENEWIKETLIYTFEYISIIFILNLKVEIEKVNKENKNKEKKDQNIKLEEENIISSLKDFFEKCVVFLENLFKSKFKKEEDEKESNNNIKTYFALAFVRVYTKEFINFIENNKHKKSSEIEQIIKIINGSENNRFREMLRYFIYKIIYQIKEKDLNKLFEDEIVEKFHLKSYKNFDLFLKEKDKLQNPKDILFIEVYNEEEDDFKNYVDVFNKLSHCLKNSNDKESELNDAIKSNRIDIFYSVFSTKISAHLMKSNVDDEEIKILSNIIKNNFSDKEKLSNIFELFLNITKYKEEIKSYKAEILQFCLRFCLNSDDIYDEGKNIYYPLYTNKKDINSYLPGNDIRERKIYLNYSQIKEYLENHNSSFGVYVCICNIYKETDENINIIYEEGNNGYPIKSEVCQYCNEPIGNEDGQENSFYERDSYFRIFKNKEDLERESKNKKKGNCITLGYFFDKYLSNKLKEDSKGVNISNKEFFDNTDKPIRHLSQIGFRLMNLILYSHLFTNNLFNDKEELFAGDYSYLDYIVGNWKKLNVLLNKKGIDIFIFMNLIYTDLLKYLNNQKPINDYNKLLEVEKEIENIIENKIFKKTIEEEDKMLTKYESYLRFYNKKKNEFRIKDTKSITSLIKEVNMASFYKDESKYPYYKSFLYTDFLDIKFFKLKLEESNKIKYPVIDYYLNKKNIKKIDNNFQYFNFVIKSLINQYSDKISKEQAKNKTFDTTNVYKQFKDRCEKFIDIINQRNCEQNLTEKSTLDNFLINRGEKKVKILIEIYKEYAEYQNNLLKDLIKKINENRAESIKCQEINIMEAQRGDLLTLEFENKSESIEIFLMNTFREMYNNNLKIKYNNYNLYNVDFEKIEKLFEDILVRNACFLKTDEIIEMRYSDEDFLNDGIQDFRQNLINKNIKLESLDEKEKMEFIKIFDEELKNNLPFCKEINVGFKNIINYINKNINSININKCSINDFSKIVPVNKILKEFLEKHSDIKISKLIDFNDYFENLYFELAMENTKNYKEKYENIDKFEEYYKNKPGQLLTKEKLSCTIIKFLLIIIINENNEIPINMEENLFNYLNNKYLWNNDIYIDNRFSDTCKEYYDLNIKVKNAYDFYSHISIDYKSKFEKEKNKIVDKIRIAKKEEEKKKKDAETEEKRMMLENKNEEAEKETNDGNDDDNDEGDDDAGEFDFDEM